MCYGNSSSFKLCRNLRLIVLLGTLSDGVPGLGLKSRWSQSRWVTATLSHCHWVTECRARTAVSDGSRAADRVVRLGVSHGGRRVSSRLPVPARGRDELECLSPSAATGSARPRYCEWRSAGPGFAEGQANNFKSFCCCVGNGMASWMVGCRLYFFLQRILEFKSWSINCFEVFVVTFDKWFPRLLIKEILQQFRWAAIMILPVIINLKSILTPFHCHLARSSMRLLSLVPLICYGWSDVVVMKWFFRNFNASGFRVYHAKVVLFIW